MEEMTHTYFSKAWFKDPQTWTLIVAFAWSVITDPTFNADFPRYMQAWIAKGVLLVALWQRFYSVKRPVGRKEGMPVEVRSIPPATEEQK